MNLFKKLLFNTAAHVFLYISSLFILLLVYEPCWSQDTSLKNNVVTGAERMDQYLGQLQRKNIALVVNQTSMVGKRHLVDTLLSRKIHISKIFAPEHGFRGNADAGESVSEEIDSATGIPVVSIYGNRLKPTPENLQKVDMVVYDIQDVGVRFYTYVSTLHYVMEACAENKIPLLVLDRPDPNGFYVDGPVMEDAYKSFVGMDPVPVVYGMTPAEYAGMLNGEGWLKDQEKCELHYVPCFGYDHSTLYELPIPPSPNLRTMTAIYLYPSLCFLEGTPVSVGRGTDKPFMLIGYPGFEEGNARFTPKSIPGAKNPPYLNKECNGYNVSGLNTGFFVENRRILFHWLVDFYTSYPEKDKFFTPFFNTLAGTDQLRKQIEKGTSEMEIRRSWEPQLSAFKTIRKKYLLYKDFDEN